MIALASDCLLFKMATGESIPYSAEMITIQFSGNAAQLFDAEFVQHASQAVFHYFKYELRRQTVSVGEFAQALEKVLRGFALTARARHPLKGGHQTAGLGVHPLGCGGNAISAASDLRLLAQQSGKACELLFFPRLREQLRQQLREGCNILRFKGLRGCAKQLTGARRRCVRCRDLEEQIVNFLRNCLTAEQQQRQGRIALVVE